MSDALKPLIAHAAARNLTRQEAETAFDILFRGDASPAQIAGFLMALSTRGESVEEYAAAAYVMRNNALGVNVKDDAMDIVGTGGTGLSTLNISTATAFVVAAAGVTVAKHGNRKLSSNSGAADVLTQIGVDVMLPPASVEKVIEQTGIGFMMAPLHHPATKHVAPVRAELGTRTIFNILGPLTNPAGVKRQLTGAFSPELLRPMAETLAALGSERAWLVHGSDGTDELTVTGKSQVVALESGEIREFELHPEEAGLPVHRFDDIRGGTPEQNAKAFMAVMHGEKNAYRDAVLLNAAAAFLIAGRTNTLQSGVELAAETIDSGAALKKVKEVAALTQAASKN